MDQLLGGTTIAFLRFEFLGWNEDIKILDVQQGDRAMCMTYAIPFFGRSRVCQRTHPNDLRSNVKSAL